MDVTTEIINKLKSYFDDHRTNNLTDPIEIVSIGVGLDVSAKPTLSQLPSAFFSYGDIRNVQDDLVGYDAQIITINVFATVNVTNTKDLIERCGDMRLLVHRYVSALRNLGISNANIIDARVRRVLTDKHIVHPYQRLIFMVDVTWEEML